MYTEVGPADLDYARMSWILTTVSRILIAKVIPPRMVFEVETYKPRQRKANKIKSDLSLNTL